MSRTIKFAKAGGPEVLEFLETEAPAPGPSEVRIKVKVPYRRCMPSKYVP
jgi:NADPH:quinone reductase-like Zn-dependent oxidoreductase